MMFSLGNLQNVLNLSLGGGQEKTSKTLIIKGKLYILRL